MDKDRRTKRKVIIKQNKPVISVEKKLEKLFGRMKGTIQIVGDVISPVDEDWDAAR